MLIRGVLILECFQKHDPGSEGLFLSHMFDLMEVENQYVEVRTKKQFLSLLLNSPYNIIHITTHGSVVENKKRNKFLGLWFPDGNLTRDDLENIKNKLKNYSIISTACQSGNQKYSREFAEKTGCRYYVAPSGSPKFYNAIFFAHIFYHKHFILKKKIGEILIQYNDRYRNPHKFAAISFKIFIGNTMEKRIKRNK